jgi:hypothetical protein
MAFDVGRAAHRFVKRAVFLLAAVAAMDAGGVCGEQCLRITLTVGTALIPLALACVAWGLLAVRRRGTLQALSAQI